MTGRVVKLYVECSQKSVQDLARVNNALTGRRQGLVVLHDKKAIRCD